MTGRRWYQSRTRRRHSTPQDSTDVPAKAGRSGAAAQRQRQQREQRRNCRVQDHEHRARRQQQQHACGTRARSHTSKQVHCNNGSKPTHNWQRHEPNDAEGSRLLSVAVPEAAAAWSPVSTVPSQQSPNQVRKAAAQGAWSASASNTEGDQNGRCRTLSVHLSGTAAHRGR